MQHRIRGLPLLGQYDRVATLAEMGPEELTQQVGRKRAGELAALAQLTVVYAIGVVAADPLGPAVEVQQSVTLVAGLPGVTHEPEMRLQTQGGKRLGQSLDACGEATDAGVGVRSLE